MKLYYHGTCELFVDSIKRDGLIPNKEKGADSWRGWYNSRQKPGVFLTANAEIARTFSHLVASLHKSTGALFSVEFPADKAGELAKDAEANEVFESARYPDAIPPDWLKYCGSTGKTGAHLIVATNGLERHVSDY